MKIRQIKKEITTSIAEQSHFCFNQANEEQELYFEGTQDSFNKKIVNMTKQKLLKISICKIIVQGEQIKKTNAVCLFLTIFFGLILIFPLLLCCFSFYKKFISQIFVLKSETYQNFAQLLSIPQLKQFHLSVFDNNLTINKIKKLENSLKGKQKKQMTFYFENLAGAFNNQEYEYDCFAERFKKLIKQFPKGKAQAIWYKKTVK